eukprot:scaffold3856_cov169-Amphora_coffeaeformis.AAC.8
MSNASRRRRRQAGNNAKQKSEKSGGVSNWIFCSAKCILGKMDHNSKNNPYMEANEAGEDSLVEVEEMGYHTQDVTCCSTCSTKRKKGTGGWCLSWQGCGL